MFNNRRLLLIPAMLISLVIVVLVINGVRATSLTSKLTVQVAPEDSKILIDGHKRVAGTWKVHPGDHTVVFSHAGFSNNTENVSVDKDQTLFVGAALVSNSADTANWYQTHPQDAKTAESISSKNVDKVASQQTTQLPLIKDLPFVDQYYRVDYGKSVAHPDEPSAVAIYIKYYSDAGKQQALDWIKFKGYDPNKLEIVYTALPLPN